MLHQIEISKLWEEGEEYLRFREEVEKCHALREEKAAGYAADQKIHPQQPPSPQEVSVHPRYINAETHQFPHPGSLQDSGKQRSNISGSSQPPFHSVQYYMQDNPRICSKYPPPWDEHPALFLGARFPSENA